MTHGQSAEGYCENCFQSTAVYFCEHCHTVLCSKCLTKREEKISVCSTCHSADLEVNSSYTIEGDQIIEHHCTYCDNSGIVEAIRQIHQCPKCLSEDVIDSDKKIKLLIKTHQEAGHRLRFPYRQLQKITGFFSEMKDQLTKIRNFFLHYPSIETNLLRVHQSLPRLEDQFLGEIRNVTQQFHSLLHSISSLDHIPPRQIRIYHEAVSHLEAESGRIERFTRDLLRPIITTLNDTHQLLEKMENWQKKFQDYIQLVPFAVDELFVGLIPNVKIISTDFDAHIRYTGHLLLTNRRFILLGKKGFIRKHIEKLVEYYLPDTPSVTIQGRFSRNLSLMLKPGHIRISQTEDVLKEIEELYKLAVQFDQERLQDLHLTRQISQLRIDLSGFKSQIQTYIKGSFTYKPSFDPLTVSPTNDYVYPSTSRYNESNGTSTELPSFIFEPPPTATTNYSPSYSSPPTENREIPFPSSLAYTPSYTSSEDTSIDVIQLQGERHSIKSTIQWLKEQWERAKISQQDYLQQYRELMRQLYMIESKLRNPSLNSHDHSRSTTTRL